MATPTSLMQTLSRDMDRLLDEFAPRSRWSLPAFLASGDRVHWIPDIEVMQHDGAYVVKADLPGMTRDDVHVQVERDRVVIEGERKEESEEKREGYYRTERTYGHFRRAVGLPEGAEAEKAKATFKDGVLSVSVPVAATAAPKARELPIE